MLAIAGDRRSRTIPQKINAFKRSRDVSATRILNTCTMRTLMGAAVAEWLDCSPPTEATQPGHSRIFASGNRAGRCRCSQSFIGDSPFLPVLAFRRRSVLITTGESEQPYGRTVHKLAWQCSRYNAELYFPSSVAFVVAAAHVVSRGAEAAVAIGMTGSMPMSMRGVVDVVLVVEAQAKLTLEINRRPCGTVDDAGAINPSTRLVFTPCRFVTPSPPFPLPELPVSAPLLSHCSISPSLPHLRSGSTTLGPHSMDGELLQYQLEIESIYFGIIRRHVGRMAFQLAVRNDIQYTFHDENAGRA
ncbi:hypothetical protein PR048_007845 [Dryococelus australis]|uniref:Uncharacterized protein n=1 Tax=Dryococelus australis TaxID=614101 RepID=A0ABQ9HWB3_9NEOP|nr:hypothetical protein PR048_007845 [Dryococelus australis]